MKSTYSQPKVAVVMLILGIDDGVLKVALYKREREPFMNQYSLPAGLILANESLDEAAKRVLKEKTGIEDVYLEQLHAFGDPNRDPVQRTIGIAYFALVRFEEVELEKDTAQWGDVKTPVKSFDHEEIMEFMLSELRQRILYSEIVHSLLPDQFTLTQLQKVYETILAEKIDKRNFRKKILSLSILKKSDKKVVGQRQRPAQLYRFIVKKTL